MPPVAATFETISTAKVARSAAEAKQLGFLGPRDEIVMNRDRLLAAAKAKALALAAAYQPPAPTSFRLPGPSGKAALMLAVDNFVRLGKATAYDRIVAEGLADVLTGGPEADPVEPLPEDKISQLERQTIMRAPPPAQDAGPHGAHARHRQAAAELREKEVVEAIEAASRHCSSWPGKRASTATREIHGPGSPLSRG